MIHFLGISISFAFLNKRNIIYGFCEDGAALVYKTTSNSVSIQRLEDQKEKWNLEMTPAPLDMRCDGPTITFLRRDSDSTFEFGWIEYSSGKKVGHFSLKSNSMYEIRLIDSVSAIGFRDNRVFRMQFERKSEKCRINITELYRSNSDIEPVSNISRYHGCLWEVVSAPKLGIKLGEFCPDSVQYFNTLSISNLFITEKKVRHDMSLDDFCMCGEYMFWARNELPRHEFILFKYNLKDSKTEKIGKFEKRISLLGCNQKNISVTDWTKDYIYPLEK